MKTKLRSLKQLFVHILGMVLLLAAISFVFFFWALPYMTNKGEIVSVPDISGLPFRDAIEALEKQRLGYEVRDSAYDRHFPPLTVLEQFPRPSGNVKVNRRIQLVLNVRRPPSVIYPDFAGADLEFATQRLTLLGLKVGQIEFVPDIAHGAVLDSRTQGKSLEAGALVPKETTIDLVIGMKDEK